VEWIKLAQDWIQWHTSVNTVMRFRIRQKRETFE